MLAPNTLEASATSAELNTPDARRAARLHRPRTVHELHGYITAILGFSIPRRPIVPGHAAPFDYVTHTFFEPQRATPARDAVVWANRGGGKTQIGAIVTLLDMLFKPGIQIRILGGSLEQSSKMLTYLRGMLLSDIFEDLIAGNFTAQHVELINGSRVEVLSQSECSVRGQRVHKLRCDEVELFSEEIWEAAQLVTRSGQCGETYVHASIDALSTMHRPYGLMDRLVKSIIAGESAHSRPRTLFRWSALDVLQPCSDEHQCNTCCLWDECKGAAKTSLARGFLRIDDAIQQKRRVGEATWRSEMLCLQPSRADTVYPEFDPAIHVRLPCLDEPSPTVPNRPRAAHHLPNHAPSTWIGGIDFGYREPTVVLLGRVDSDDVLHIMDELVLRETLAQRVIELTEQRIQERAWPRPRWLGADPAGNQRSCHSGLSSISLWRRSGWSIRDRHTRIEDGINAVHARLKRADGTISLRIHPRCTSLIEALTMYHYPPADTCTDLDRAQPVKDGHDHAADALRYMIVNLDRPGWRVEFREY